MTEADRYYQRPSRPDVADAVARVLFVLACAALIASTFAAAAGHRREAWELLGVAVAFGVGEALVIASGQGGQDQ